MSTLHTPPPGRSLFESGSDERYSGFQPKGKSLFGNDGKGHSPHEPIPELAEDDPVAALKKQLGANAYRLTPATFAHKISFGQWIPANHLRFISAKVATAMTRGRARICISIPPRHGKALKNGTLVKIPGGFKPIEDLMVGDEVCIPSSHLNGPPSTARITGVHPQGKVQLYRVSLGDGSQVECCEEHIWHVRYKNTSKALQWVNWTIKQIMSVGLTQKHGKGATCNNFHIPTRAYECESIDFPIKPYTLGALIGDGSLTQHPSICCHIDDAETLKHMEKDGCKFGEVYQRGNTMSRQLLNLPFWRSNLTDLGLYGKKSENKFIPEIYFEGSIKQRIALLQGLMDTDGTFGSGASIFNTSSHQLAKNVQRLVRSLGGLSSISERTAPAKLGYLKAYNVNVRLPNEICPFRLKRKIAVMGGRKFTNINTIKHIEPTTVDYATCISIDSDDGLFLVTENNIVTHNSELFSVYMPIWILDRSPDRRVMQCAYAAELATEFSQRSRDIILEDSIEGYNNIRCTLRKDSKRADRYRTGIGQGGVVAAGVGGAITGRGANDLLIDDYMKNAKESQSEVLRNDHWEWLKSTAMTRLEPNGNTVIIATRWNVDDMIGRLIEEENEKWEFIKLKAIAEDDDPLGRKPGTPLWPERYDLRDMDEIKVSLGTFWWQALYQQEPLASMSDLFKDSWLPIITEVPPKIMKRLRLVRYWDFASGDSKDSDFTTGALLGHDRQEDVTYILDLARGRWTSGTIESRVMQTAKSDTTNVKIIIEQEPGSAGKAMITNYKNIVLPRFTVGGDRVTGPKTVRVSPFLAAAEGKKIKMLHAPWNKELLNEFRSFPDGVHDDIVDSVGGAYAQLHQGRANAGTWGRDASSVKHPFGHQLEDSVIWGR